MTVVIVICPQGSGNDAKDYHHPPMQILTLALKQPSSFFSPTACLHAVTCITKPADFLILGVRRTRNMQHSGSESSDVTVTISLSCLWETCGDRKGISRQTTILIMLTNNMMEEGNETKLLPFAATQLRSSPCPRQKRS